MPGVGDWLAEAVGEGGELVEVNSVACQSAIGGIGLELVVTGQAACSDDYADAGGRPTLQRSLGCG